jgi:lysozyme
MKNKELQINELGINIIKHFEGIHDGDLRVIGLQPKMCPSGVWTEGYGRAMRNDKGRFIKGAENKALAYSRITIHTEEQAEKALYEDCKIFESIVRGSIDIQLTPNQFSMLVSYTYNTGGSATLWRLINGKFPKSAIKDWIENHYITGGGKKLAGLVRRRKAEAVLFFTE